MGITLTAEIIPPMSILTLAPGGFFVFGILIALANKLSDNKISKSTAGYGTNSNNTSNKEN